MKTVALLLAVAAAVPAGTPAQTRGEADTARPTTADTSLEPMTDVLARARQRGVSGAAPTAIFGLSSDCAGFGDDSTRSKCWRAYQEYFDYYQSGFAHRRKVFWWQHVSTRIIFVVVLALVSAGILFAWMQFRKDLIAAPVSGLPPTPALHQMEIGKTGVKVSSPVLGVIILVISLAFFYLYLVFVYPIKEIL